MFKFINAYNLDQLYYLSSLKLIFFHTCGFLLLCRFLLYTLLFEFSYHFFSFDSDNKPVPKKSDGDSSSGVNTEVVKKNVPHSTSANNVVKASQTTKPKHSEVGVDPSTSFHHTLSDLSVAVMGSVDKIPPPEESQKYLEEKYQCLRKVMLKSRC